MTKLVAKCMHFGRKTKQLMIDRFFVKSQPTTRSKSQEPHCTVLCVRLDDCLCSYLLCCGLHRFMVHGYVSRLWPGLFQVFSLTCLSHIITALRKACAFVCIAGGFVRTLGIGLFENDSSRRVKYRGRTMSIASLHRLLHRKMHFLFALL